MPKSIHRIMVAMDFSSMDEKLLSYAAFFAQHLDSKELIGVHVIPVLRVGNIFKVEVGHILQPAAPAVDKIREALEEKANTFLKNGNRNIRVEIAEGRPYSELRKLIEESNTDLLIVGKKERSTGSGITAKRTARQVDSDLLFVPEGSKPKISNILVASDFSDNAFRALEKALHLAAQLNLKEKIILLHVIDIPSISLYGDEDIYKKAATALPTEARQMYRDFVYKNKLDEEKLNPVFFESHEMNIATAIKTYANEIGADLIVIGAKGHNPLENFFFGSVTEGLVEKEFAQPVWIVR